MWLRGEYLQLEVDRLGEPGEPRDQISVAEDALGEAELLARFPAHVFDVCREPRERHHPRLEGQVASGVG